jgi:hypothetical protein
VEKQISVDQIEVVPNGTLQIRFRVDVIQDDAVISSSFERKVIVPGQPYGDEDQKVKDVCSSVHTPEVIAAFEASVVANKGKGV